METTSENNCSRMTRSQTSQMEIDAKRETDKGKEDQEFVQLESRNVESSSIEVKDFGKEDQEIVEIETTSENNCPRITRSQISKENSSTDNSINGKNILISKSLKRKTLNISHKKKSRKAN